MEIKSTSINSTFWKKKKIFITGHTGFKGSWLCIWLKILEAKVCGYSLKPPTSPSLFKDAKVSSVINKNIIADVRDKNLLRKEIKKFSPDIIFHMAAQPLVRNSYLDVLNTFETNIMGTVNLLEAARQCNTVKTIINITTDKCYENKEWAWGYREVDRLGGKDPYSNSKACSELVTQSFRDSFFFDKRVGIATVRSGNVIGGGDWAEDRLIPDVFRSILSQKILKIRNPKSVRPWQHVLEPLFGYLLLAEKLQSNHKLYSGSWNFGPNYDDCKSVEWIISFMSLYLEKLKWKIDNNAKKLHEANLLKLDISKANNLLKWYPRWNLKRTLTSIINWHDLYNKKKDIYSACISEINNFMKTK
jgi:CDP-glucose 4,6-dehydratase